MIQSLRTKGQISNYWYGAGDAFVGGFLSQCYQNQSIQKSVAGGHYVANVVIQRTRTSNPSAQHTFTFENK